jgi:transcription factor C subunit 6
LEVRILVVLNFLMTRQLRPRKGRTNYAALADFDTDEEKQAHAGPSSINIHADIAEVESDFMPEKDEEKAKEGEREDLEEDIAEDDTGENWAKVKPKSGSLRNGSPSGKQRLKAGKNATRHGQKRSQYALPTPLVNHRHRGVPLFSRSARVERLAGPPKLFGPTSTVLTASFTNSSKVTDRVSKAWGFNVGPGPLWELAEDRGWFKEAEVIGNDVEMERKRRPRVYREVCVRAGLELLDAE